MATVLHLLYMLASVPVILWQDAYCRILSSLMGSMDATGASIRGRELIKAGGLARVYLATGAENTQLFY